MYKHSKLEANYPEAWNRRNGIEANYSEAWNRRNGIYKKKAFSPKPKDNEMSSQ